MQTSGNIQDLVDRVMEKAKAEAAAIIDRAQRASDRDLQEAKERSERMLAAIKAEADAELDQMRRTVASETRQKERKSLMEHQEAAVREALVAAIAHLRDGLPAARRRALLVEAVRDGVARLGRQTARVRMNAADRADAPANGFPPEIGGVAVRIDEDTLDCAGGAVVFDEERRVMVDNTFEAVIDRRRESLRTNVAKCLSLRGMEP